MTFCGFWPLSGDEMAKEFDELFLRIDFGFVGLVGLVVSAVSEFDWFTRLDGWCSYSAKTMTSSSSSSLICGLMKKKENYV